MQRLEPGQACVQQFLEDEGFACRLPGMALANQAFWGASPVGPYNKNRTGAPAERIERVRMGSLSRDSCAPCAATSLTACFKRIRSIIF